MHSVVSRERNGKGPRFVDAFYKVGDLASLLHRSSVSKVTLFRGSRIDVDRVSITVTFQMIVDQLSCGHKVSSGKFHYFFRRNEIL